jgi:hypothetical protein
MQTRESVNANDMCSASWYAPTAYVIISAIPQADFMHVRTPLDGVNGDKKRYSEALPKREEQNTFHAKEFGCGRSSLVRRRQKVFTGTYEAA